MIEGQLANGAKLQPRNFSGFLNLAYYGNVFYVSSVTGSDTANAGVSPDKPVATIAAAAALCTASNDDVIIVLPGHAETVTASITLSKAGVKVLGLGDGMRRPAVTGNGTIDVFNVTGANVTIENIAFPAPGTDDATADINVAAAGCTIRNCYFIGSQTSKNKTDMITVASGGDDLLVEGCRAYNTVVDCVSWLSLEAAVNRPVIRDNIILGTFSTANIMDEATAVLIIVQRNILKNTKTTGKLLDLSTGNSTGVISFNHMSGRNTTIASNYALGTAIDVFENRVVEEPVLNGMILPVADAD